MNRIINFLKKEIVFCAAFMCALVSAFFVPPSAEYFSYIDRDTLFILFALMAVIQALKSCGVFSSLASAMCRYFHTVRSLSAALVFLSFFTAMLITNDVALITFVPFAIALLTPVASPFMVMYTVVLQTVAANTGSMLTPLGNPQNLFLFGQMGISLFDFIKIVSPYTLTSFLILAAGVCVIPKKAIVVQPEIFSNTADDDPAEKKLEKNAERASVKKSAAHNPAAGCRVKKIIYALLFALCILSVLRIVPKWCAAVCVLAVIFAADKKILLSVDYMLLLTFTAFFIFTGNIAKIESVRLVLQEIVRGNEFLSAVVSSQVISNVPAALLLFPFSGSMNELLVGVNAGGLGTLVASLASLISFKIFSAGPKEKRSSTAMYLGVFTLCNIAVLLVLVFEHFLLRN
ncbi:MAG: citrate transporter [Treponema sp.]|nr:citrate transporter [Treponema sp.]